VIVGLFAGVGVGLGLRTLGLDEAGFDVDPDVCANRARLGLTTVRADVATWPLEPLTGRVSGLWASPPCQDWSSAGRRAGRAGESGWLVDEPLRWVLELRPRWSAWEQVPEALPVWQAAAPALRLAGYSVWTGILCAADYGVPQVRRRAILMASLDQPAHPPVPTHAEDPKPTLFGPALRPWVTMADALGWGFDDTPGRTVCGNREPRWTSPDRDGTHGRIALRCDRGRGMSERHGDRPALTFTAKSGGQWVFQRPATTVCADPRLAAPGHRDRAGGEPQFGDESVRLTVEEAAVLQGFPPGVELVGSKTARFRVVGNAVPPSLAAAIVNELTGRPF
jgi:DNA (cytosine-5)-methyltransferase 1